MIEEVRTIEEVHAVAVHSSNLKCVTREGAPRSDSDILMASGWCRSRVGAALLRLRTEYDSAEKPRLLTAADFKKQAEEMAREANEQQAMLLAGKLKTLKGVQEQLVLQALVWKQESPEALVRAVVMWWLHSKCGVCNGTGKEAAGRASRACKHCRGTGEAQLPGGHAGKKLLNEIDFCLQSALNSINKRLRTMR